MPFIGSLLMRLELVPVSDCRLDTASTDGDNIYVDIEFYSKLDAAERAFVLAHEAWHLNGIADEGTTHCYALQSGVRLGMRLGLTESVARRMMRQQFVENASRARRAPEYLVSDDCRDGGALDLRPDDPEFP